MNNSGCIIGFMSAPGGVGKTILSLTLGWFLRREGKNVLLIDLDPSISLSLYIVKNEMELVNYEKKGKTLSNIIEKVLEKDELVELNDFIISRPYPSPDDPEIDVLIPDIKLADKIDMLWFGPRAGRERILSELLEKLEVRKRYDFIIIDTIPFYDRKYAIMILYAADFCVIPLRPTIIDIYRTVRMLRELPKITRMEASKVYGKLGLLFNMLDRRSSKQKKLIDSAKRLFKEKISSKLVIFDKVIPKLIAFSRIGTEEEVASDRKKVEDSFEPFYKEFVEWMSKSKVFSRC